MASKDPCPPQDPQVRVDDANDAAARAEDMTQAQISRQLRQIYETVQGEGIPDRFLELLQKLDEAEKAQHGGYDGDEDE